MSNTREFNLKAEEIFSEDLKKAFTSVEAFKKYINNPDTVLDSKKINLLLLRSNEKKDNEKKDNETTKSIIREKFAPLMRKIKTDILENGLYAKHSDSSTDGILIGSIDDNIHIGSNTAVGRTLMVIETNKGNSQLSVLFNKDNPAASDIELILYQGTFSDIEKLVEKSIEIFSAEPSKKTVPKPSL